MRGEGAKLTPPMRVFLTLLLTFGPVCFGHDVVTPKPKLLQKGTPIEGLSGRAGDTVVFKFIVPPQAEALVFKTSGGRGDVDLYARHNVFPTRDHFDGASRLQGVWEVLALPQPEEGIWYVLVDAYSDFSDVRLNASYKIPRGTIDIPRCIPGPGVFSGSAVVELKCSSPRSVIRFTTDHSEPVDSSSLYSKPLMLTGDTRVRAKAFGRNGKISPELDAEYDVRPPGTVTDLTNGVPAHHLAGSLNSVHLFKVDVPEGGKSLTVSTEGGTGKTELLLKFGSPPTAIDFDRKSHEKGKRASIEMKQPTAGEWFVGVRGWSHFSGVSASAFVRPEAVDLIPWQPALQPYASVETFSENDCEVQEGMTTPGAHTLLRFNTETRNIGNSDLVMPSPINNPNFEFAECHGHYHFKGFARYRLLDVSGVEVASGRKVSFCLLDLSRWDPKANHVGHYDCEEQGIQAGWADVYDSGLPGQWIDITDVPAGVYMLEITMNPDHVIPEADYSNNTAVTEVIIE